MSCKQEAEPRCEYQELTPQPVLLTSTTRVCPLKKKITSFFLGGQGMLVSAYYLGAQTQTYFTGRVVLITFCHFFICYLALFACSFIGHSQVIFIPKN